MITAVLFDMDGVVIDSRTVIESVWARVLARRTGRDLSRRDIDEHVHGRVGSHTVAALFPDHPTAHAEIWAEADELEQSATYDLIPGVHALLRALAAARVTTGLVTGSAAGKTRAATRALDIRFATVITREDVRNAKPHPEPYERACANLGVRPEDVLVFEDSHSGVQAARAAGARCVGIGDDPALLEAGALATITDFTHLTVRTDSAGTHLESHDFGLTLSPGCPQA
ncbi:HAD-IA family hydrolase [Actinokineospora auranticolor]|uniref:HAD superfamily hydrolase (TIGR01509 family)/HAD superfamily hydrolase (TIGR01549 family) n=1 Tax=Actinokineospora auranticolor TaxID=155976 RepID=A0A2S6GJS6_9PSEU|nr:HAD-IA family hydrolase [Actinokineospora auranticolor]PPK65406.1 HAD superfamily hydrolase (TIGR01509 family)/HAD superfamily hydrolase (TIGR01549 family) [Actinokineospora auranticolor]